MAGIDSWQVVVTDGGISLWNNLLDGFGLLGSTDHTLVKICAQLTQRTGESTQQQHPAMNKGIVLLMTILNAF